MTALQLLHGVGLDHRMWRRCRPQLDEQHEVTAPDLPGHGASAAVPSGWTLREVAGSVSDAVAEPTHLVGFSLGALVAQRIALDRPELVRSLTLVSSVADRSPEQSRAVAARLHEAEHDFDAVVDRAVARWMADSWRAAEPELAEELRTTLRRQHRPSYLRCYRIFAEADQELRPLLGGITAPTLAITGAHDPGSTPEMSERLAARIARARADVLPGVRHLVPLEAPQRLAEAILAHTQEVDHAEPAQA